jgi:hypothetical protein
MRLLPVLLLTAACGGALPQDNAQRVLTAIASGYVEADHVLADRYTAAHNEAMDASETRAAYDAAMVPWRVAVDTSTIVRHLLVAAQRALDAWRLREEDEARWVPAAACVAEALRRLAGAFEVVHIELPGPLATAIGRASSFTGECNREWGTFERHESAAPIAEGP